MSAGELVGFLASRRGLQEASLKKGMHGLQGGGNVNVQPMAAWRRKSTGMVMSILVWPEDSSVVPDASEEARLLAAASKKLGVGLEWAEPWAKHKYAGFYRSAKPTEKVVRGRSREIGKWLDAEVVRGLDEHYRDYEAGRLRREPSITAAGMMDLLNVYGSPEEWRRLATKAKVSRVQATLKRLRKKGLLNTSTGEGPSGREARLYEPMWFAKKHGNA